MIILRLIAFTVLSPFLLSVAVIMVTMYILRAIRVLALYGELLGPRGFFRE